MPRRRPAYYGDNESNEDDEGHEGYEGQARHESNEDHEGHESDEGQKAQLTDTHIPQLRFTACCAR